jgi:hypothetical protein
MNTVEEKHSKFLNLPIENIKISDELRIKSLYELSKLYVKILTDFEYGLIQVYNKIPKNSVDELYSQTTDIFATTNAMIKHQIVSENASLFPYTAKNNIEMSMLKSMQKEKWREQWKEFLSATQETVNNTIAISSSILSPAAEWTKIGMEGVGEVGETAIKSILMKPFHVIVDETYAMSITALSAVSVVGVAFMMIISMCYYQFVGKMVFSSAKNKSTESSVTPPPPPPSSSEKFSEFQRRWNMIREANMRQTEPSVNQLPSELPQETIQPPTQSLPPPPPPTPTSSFDRSAELHRRLNLVKEQNRRQTATQLQPETIQPPTQYLPPPPPQPSPLNPNYAPLPYQPPPPGTNPAYAQQHYNDYLRQVHAYNQNQYLQQVNQYNQYNPYLQQQQQQQYSYPQHNMNFSQR